VVKRYLLPLKYAIIVDESKKAGYWTVKWDGRDESGKKVALGIYFYRMDAGEFSTTRKLAILR